MISATVPLVQEAGWGPEPLMTIRILTLHVVQLAVTYIGLLTQLTRLITWAPQMRTYELYISCKCMAVQSCLLSGSRFPDTRLRMVNIRPDTLNPRPLLSRPTYRPSNFWLRKSAYLNKHLHRRLLVLRYYVKALLAVTPHRQPEHLTGRQVE